MGNCTVVKFNGNINDDTLKVFNHFVLSVSQFDGSVDESSHSINVTGATTISATGGTFDVKKSGSIVETNVTEYVNSSGTATIIFNSGSYKARISNTYTLDEISYTVASGSDGFLSFDIEDLSYIKKTLVIKYGTAPSVSGVVRAKGGVETIRIRPTANTSYGGEEIVFNTQNIKNTSSLKTLELYGFSKASGSIEDLADNVNMTFLDCFQTSIGGEILQFAAKQVAAGRTSGTITMPCCAANVTYNGNVVTHGWLVDQGGSWNVWIKYDPSYENGYKVFFIDPNA